MSVPSRPLEPFITASADVRARFARFVPNGDGCWEWGGGRNAAGYGHFKVYGFTYIATRVAWTFAYGITPGALLVCHHCDNPPCVRPDHLFLGTNKDNTRDGIAKGRIVNPCGDESRQHRLTRAEVDEARRLYRETDMRQEDIAALYGVRRATIGKVLQNIVWIDPSYAPPVGRIMHGTRRGSALYQAKLSERDIPAIRSRAAGGEPLKSIALDYGVNRATIGDVVRGATWRHVA